MQILKCVRYLSQAKHINVKFDPIGQCNPQQQMVDYYKKNGHLAAQLDPLGIQPNLSKSFPSVLDFNIKYDDPIQPNLLHHQVNDVSQLETKLQKLFTSSVGVQFEHVEDFEEREWLYKNYEQIFQKKLTDSEIINLHNIIVQQEAIEHFMHKKFVTFKRYSGEGGESTAVLLRSIYAFASSLGVTDVVQSMAHRGRFAIMMGLLNFPPQDIFRKVQKDAFDLPEEFTNAYNADDVVHHMSTSNKCRFPGAGCQEQDIRISIVHNPSHLEAANPVSQGKTRAKQDDYGNQDQVLNIQMHGDAAFAGQGIVYEALQLNKLSGYQNGGTIHIIQNNQIGYTTNVSDSRSTRYSSDIAIPFGIPIIHVNGEDVETIHLLGQFVAQYRQQFKKDILIDLITYRKYGHNEVDEPSFTQPLMYQKVRSEQSLPVKFNKLLNERGLKCDYEKVREKVFKNLETEYSKPPFNKTLEIITNENTKGSKSFTGKWKGLNFSQFYTSNPVTGVQVSHLKDLAQQSVVIKNEFNVHPRLQKYFIDDRIEQVNQNKIDWATAESIAVSSLLEEGYNVRLSGQDVERGTFSQRHFVFVDQKTEEKWNPIQSFAEAKHQGRLQVCNSPLSEAAVMAYDFGYSMENPRNLVIWEAQFGDFYNTGQFIVDAFITCSEEKWMRQSSLVMLLPHGYDGAGPEHSSSRMERWLQQGVQNQNFQFVVPSTPSTVFHMLRRQMHRNFRKPLIVASAKSLLRSQKARCSFEELGQQFKPIIVHGNLQSKIIVITYGKMVYEVQELVEKSQNDYTIIALEQLLPFPQKELQEIFSKMPENSKVVYLQEEPKNAGGWSYCREFIQNAINNSQLRNKELKYFGRKECPQVAGASHLFTQEMAKVKQEFLQFQ